MRHRTDGKYGENISSSSGIEETGSTSVNRWYDEVQHYKYGHEFSASTGHFTQVVWKNSVNFGIGVAKSNNGTTYVVANYDPPGNFRGEFTENVLQPKGSLFSKFIPEKSKTAPVSSPLLKQTNSNQHYTEFQLECLRSHNAYRNKHGVGMLTLNPELNNYAQEWADVS